MRAAGAKSRFASPPRKELSRIGLMMISTGCRCTPMMGRIRSEFGSEIVSYAGSRGKIKIRESATERIIEDRIDDDIDGMQVHANDGPNLRGKTDGFPIRCVVTKFEIRAVKECAIRGVRFYKEQADLAAINCGVVIFRNAIERQI